MDQKPPPDKKIQGTIVQEVTVQYDTLSQKELFSTFVPEAFKINKLLPKLLI